MKPVELQKTLETMRILIDTRERPTKEAERRYSAFGVPFERQKLFAGDYSAEFVLPNQERFSLEFICCIERKSGLDECCSCFTGERGRFAREFERAKNNGIKMYLLIENASWENVLNHKYRSNMNSQALMASLLAWSARYNAHVIFCKSETTPKIIKEILYREAKEILQNMEVKS